MSIRAARVDARFLIGVALVVLATVGMWFVITAARSTTTMPVAVSPILAGQVIGAEDVRLVEVALGTAADAYAVDAGAVSGMTAARAIGAGEFFPRDALREDPVVETTAVVIDAASAVPASVVRGAAVEVWVSEPDAEPQVPARVLVADATVSGVTEVTGIRRGTGPRLELIIPRSQIAAVLEAIAAGSALAVVPIGAQ